MARLRRLVLRFLNVFRSSQAEPELARELASHLRLIEEDLESRGLSPADARLAARRALGGVEQTKELHRDARSFAWFNDAGRDFRHGIRLLRRDPLFTLTAAISLAIGIGANTTIFTVVNAVLIRPLPLVDADRLVLLTSQNPDGSLPRFAVSHADFLKTALPWGWLMVAINAFIAYFMFGAMFGG